MTQKLLVVFASVAVVVALYALEAQAAPCFAGSEDFFLIPETGVTVDGFSVTRSTSSGLYEADGGLSFDVNGGAMTAIPRASGATTSCTASATGVTLTFSDPFDGPTASMQTVTAGTP